MSKRIISIFIFTVFIAALAAGCSSVAFLGGSGEIIISEVVSSNSGSLKVKNLDFPDWIELYNTSGEDIELSGYTLARSDEKGAEYTFSSGVIKAGEYFVAAAVDVVSDSEFEYPCVGYKLPKEGSDLVLKAPNGSVVSKVAVPPLESDISYAYYDGSYRYCLTATPLKANTGIFAMNIEDLYSSEYEGVYINEASRTFVEIYNGGSETVQLAYFSLSDNAGSLEKWRFPYFKLEAGGYYTVRLDGTGDVHTSFSLSNNEGFVYLAQGGEYSGHADLTNVGDGMSVGRNSAGETVYFIEPTEGEKNSEISTPMREAQEIGSEGAVYITELMLENKNSLVDEDGDRSAWVEIYNSSADSVELSNYFLTDSSDALLKWRLPDIQLAGGEYIIIYLSGKGKELHTDFKVSEGEALILTDFASFAYQNVLFPDESRLDNISYGLKDGKWLFFAKATPGRENTAHGSESIDNAEKLDKSNIFISEVSAAKPARSSTSDWIEIYNPTDGEYSLDGLFLSDELAVLEKYALTGTLEGGEYTVIYADESMEGGFSVSQSGETLYLSDGSCILDIFETGALRLGVTSGRASDDFSGERVFFSEPTKGKRNAEPLKGQLNSPEFSAEGGIVEKEFMLELSGEGEIYYTLDSSKPDTDSHRYTEPIKITDNTVVSAICASDGYLQSDASTVTYLFEQAHTVPVVCISAEASDFRSVYAVETWSSKKSDVVERECYVEYYEEDGSLGVSFPAGFRVSGNSTRSYAQKSLGIYLRSGYGQTNVVYPFFDDYPITCFKGLTLRNAGQDYDDCRIVDAYASVLFSDLNIDTAMSKFVAVYINGRYWGLYDLKENQNEDCFASQHGVDAQEINVIRRNTFAIAGDKAQVKQVYEYAQSWNLANDEKYERFCEYVDADAWIDYIIARSYCGDGDMFNQKLWNTQSYSVKWRPVFFDCDFSFRSKTSNTLSQYFTGDGFTTPDGSKTNMYIPTALKQNESWREKFVERYAQVLAYYPEYSLKLYDEMVDEIREEMKRHLQRWGFMSYSTWERNVENQREIIQARPKNIVKQIKNEFNVSTEKMKELFPDFY